MKLYKIIRMVGDHGVSVFPPEGSTMPPPEQIMGEPVTDYVRRLVFYGYTEQQAYWIVQAWVYHAHKDLNQSGRGIRIFMDMCFQKVPVLIQVPPDPWWYLAAGVAVLAAVALALVVWVYLDVDYGMVYPGHEWAYLMTYNERMWQGEILYVTPKQTGVYERGGDLRGLLQKHNRNEHYLERPLDVFWFYGGWAMGWRKLLFWHEYRWQYWDVYFCGLMTQIGPGRYKILYPGEDPYKRPGPWWRPGGFWGTPEYEGCWQEHWWL